MSLIARSIEIFKILFKRKIIKLGIAVNILYLIIGIVFYFMSSTGNDFTVYYHAGQLSITNLKLLYSPNQYSLPFRYLPISALFYSILTVFHPTLSFILYSMLSFAINIPIIIMIYYIIFDMLKFDKKHEDLTVKLIFIFLVYLPQLDNYINGQINLILLFFLLCSYCLFLSQIYAIKNRDFSKFYISNLLGGIFLGIAIMIKITALIILPFILILSSNQIIYNSKKRSVIRLKHASNSEISSYSYSPNISNVRNTSSNSHQTQIKINIWFLVKLNSLRFFGTIIVLVLNVIFFVIHPALFKQFLSINISGNTEQVRDHSISITRQILNLFLLSGISFPSIVIMLVILIPILLFNIYISLRKGFHEYYLSFYYSLALFTLYIGYYDTWVHHLVVICPFIIISLIAIKSYIENKGSFNRSDQKSLNGLEINSSKITMRDYKITMNLFLLMGAYLWLGLFFLTQNLFYNNSPGFNFIYPIIIFLLYIKIIKILIKSS